MADDYDQLTDAEIDALIRRRGADALLRRGTSAEIESARSSGAPQRTFSGPAVDYTGLEPPEGQKGSPRSGLRPDFQSLVPTQREAGEPGRAVMESVGGGLGGLGGLALAVPTAGSPAAPAAPLLPIVLGGAGAAAGSAAYDLYRDARRYVGLPDYSIPPAAGDRLESQRGAAVEDMGWSTAMQSIPGITAAWRGLRRAVSGVDREQADLGRMLLGDDYMKGTANFTPPANSGRTSALNPFGPSGAGPNESRPFIHAGVADLGENRGRTIVRTAGQMPWMGGPAHSNRARKTDSYDREANRYLGAFGPEESVPDLGRGLRGRAEEAFDAGWLESTNRYNRARTIAETAGPIIPTPGITNAVTRELSSYLDRTLPNGEIIARAFPAEANRVIGFLETLDRLPSHITVKNLDDISTELNYLQSHLQKEVGESFKVVDAVRRSAREALRTSPHNAARALVEADDFHHRLLNTFETATAKQTSRVDRNLFRPGVERPGMLRDEELYSIVKNTKSPQAIDQLENMFAYDRSPAGRAQAQQLMGSLARRYITEALQSAQLEGKSGQRIIDVNKLEDNLRLRDPQSAEYQTLQRILRAAGQDIRDFRRFAEITRAVYGNEVPDVSSYVARRTALGGSLAGAFAGGTAAGAGAATIPAALLTLLGGRYAMDLATRPSTLRALIRTYDSNMPDAAKRANYARILNALGGERTEEERYQEMGLRPKVAVGDEIGAGQ